MADQAIDYAALAKQAGAFKSAPPVTAPVDYAALAKESGAVDAPSEKPSLLDLGVELVKGVGSQLNPFPLLKSMYDRTSDEFEKALTAGKEGHIGAAVSHAMAIPHAPATAVVKGLTDAHVGQFKKAFEAYREGRLSEALGHTLAGVLPVVGPAAATIGEEIGTGDPRKIAHGAGGAVALLAPAALKYGTEVARTGSIVPTAAKVAAAAPIKVTVPGPLANNNPADAAAVDFATSHDIPVDAATATGNPVVRGAQKAAEHTSLAGSDVGRRAGQTQAEALARVGSDLAGDSNGWKAGATPIGGPTPGPAVDPIGAAERVTSALTKKIAEHATTADAAYERLRAYEAKATPEAVATGTKTVDTGVLDASGQPITRTAAVTTTAKLAVDITKSKAALDPIYQQLKREAELVPLQGGKAKTLTALDRLLNGPDVAPLSVVDDALGDLKAMSRGKGDVVPGLRSEAQGVAAQTVKQLDAQVSARAAQAGPHVLKALKEGRQATIAKYDVAEVLDSLQSASGESRAVFNKLAANKDANIGLLQNVARIAPDAVPHVGRAVLEELLGQATAEGGFDRAKGLAAKWQDLGPQTKAILYPNVALRDSLGNFFHFAKKAAENPNPSGSAYVGGLLAHGYFFRDPVSGIGYEIAGGSLASLMHSATVVRALTKGFAVNIGNKPAAAAAFGQILKAAGGEAVRVPTAADTRQETPATIGQR